MRFSLYAIGAGLIALGAGFLVSRAESTGHAPVIDGFRVEILTDRLSNPWGMAFLPDGGIIVTERPGRIRIFRDGVLGEPVSGVFEVGAQSQGGLLDIALSPDFAETGRLFLTFAETGPGGSATAVMSARLTLSGDSGALIDGRVIQRMQPYTQGNLQYGSRIAIADDGNLFVTMGDRGVADRAQDVDDLAGKVLRIAPDGSAPPGNPFIGRDGADEVWSVGHRNGQGLAIRPTDGSLWVADHGAQGGDEVNRVEPGKNYGWPVISYGVNYSGAPIGIGTSAPGMEQPIHYWDPSIAPSGMAWVEGDLFPDWRGDLLVGALKFELLVHLTMDGDRVIGEERLFQGRFGRIRDVRIGPDGAIYLLTDERRGALIRITPP